MKRLTVLTGTRADFGLLSPIIRKLMAYPDLDVRLAVTGAHLSPEFGMTVSEIEAERIPIDKKLEILLSADTPSSISKSMGLAMIGMADSFADTAPDALLVLGDRYEGADYVKFQTGVPKFDVSVFAEKAEYQKTNTGDASGSESQLEMCSKLMLPFEVYPELIACCEENHIRFLSSPFDPPCAAFLHDMGMHLWKIPSGEITHFPMLKLIASYGEPVIMSTGMATMEEIETTLNYLRKNGAGDS